MGDTSRRLLLLAVVVALLTGGTFAARLSFRGEAAATVSTTPVAAGASSVAPEAASFTAWYCSAGAPAKLVLSSFSSKALEATVVRTGGGTSESVSVPAGGQVEIAPPARAAGAQGATV